MVAVAMRISWLGSGLFVQQRLFIPVVSVNIYVHRASDCEPTQIPDVELRMINEIVKCHVTFQIRSGLWHFGPGRRVLNFQTGTKKEKMIISIHNQNYVKKSVSK